MSRIPVWFDTDIGVDDAVAFLALNRQESLELKGISAVAGNVELDYTYPNARNICRLAGKDYPVYKGADRPLLKPLETAHFIHGEEGLGKAKLPESSAPQTELPAWDALYEAAAEAKGELQLIAVGPLTNVAIALIKHPGLKKLIKRILIMGGAAAGGNSTPAAEFNIYTDPQAAQIVFKSGIPLVMCGLDVTMKAYLSPQEVEELYKHESPVCRFFRDSTSGIMDIYKSCGLAGLCLHDVCPVLYLTNPELFAGEEAGVFVETKGSVTLGKTVTDLWSDKKFPEKNCFVVLNVEREKFAATVADILKSY